MTRAPGETRLDFLVGQWRSVDRIYPGPTGRGETSEGRASYHWEVGDRWLTYEFRTVLPQLGPYVVHGGVACDPNAEGYQAYAVNNLGKLLLYEGQWQDDHTLVFTLVYPERQAEMRVSYVRRSDGTVQMTSERPSAAGGSEVYFETVLSR